MISSQLRDLIAAGGRISAADARALYEGANLTDLADMAKQVKSRFHPRDEATYLIMAIVNYTNVCVARCDYCSFYRLPHEAGTYLLDFDQVCEKIDALLVHGGGLVGFNGGFHPGLRLEDYAALFSKIRARYGGQLEFYEMTVAEFMFTCKLSKVSYAEGARRFREAGVKFISGGGAEILDDAFRKRHSPGKYTVSDYYQAQAAILASGLGSTATMVIGFDETLDERLSHLESLRDFQDANDGALVSFLCWTYKPFGNRLGGKEVSSEEYWRWLAVSRIFLDNFVNIRTSVLTKNAEALTALNYGANDFDLPTEDEVTQKAGATISHDFSSLLSHADALGFKVKMRGPYPQRLAPPAEPRHERPRHGAAAASPARSNEADVTI